MRSYDLHQFLDMYERRPQALSLELERLVDFEDEAVAPIDQAIALGISARGAQEAIKRKTLIDTTSKIGVRHTQLFAELLDCLKTEQAKLNSPILKEYLDNPELIEFVTMRSEELANRFEDDLSNNDKSGWVRRASASRVSTELMRMFADRIESITDAIETLDSTDFSTLIPECLVIPFRECHINFSLGHYGTVCILCGSIVERALKDLLVSYGTADQLIREAETEDLLNDIYATHARDIARMRNDVVHGSRDFVYVDQNRAFASLIKTRSLILELYRGRLE